MNFDPRNATLEIHGLQLRGGLALETLRALRPADFHHPVLTNGEFETWRLADDEAASHLIFRHGKLWMVKTSLHIEDDRAGGAREPWSEASEQKRHALHQHTLLTILGRPSVTCPDGTTVIPCRDPKAGDSSIVTTWPPPPSRKT